MEIGDLFIVYMLWDVFCCDIEGGSEVGDSGVFIWDE